MQTVKKGTNSNGNDVKITTFSISGMTCDHCAASIEKKFEEKEGIIAKKVSYPSASGSFEYDPHKISKNEIIDIINSTGHYTVEDEILPESKTEDFDLIIIGGGSAAFSAAIKAESLGIRTLMINDGLEFGGTCVNVGCVPSKNLVRAAETAHHANHSGFPGVKPRGADIDFKRIIQDEKQLVTSLRQLKYVDVISDFEYLTLKKGRGAFIGEKTILVDGKEKYTAPKFIVATGARTNIPEIRGLDETGYLTHIGLFSLEEKPAGMTILGAGYIGCEVAMAYNRLGVRVRIIEFTDRVLRSQMPDVSEELERNMRAEGIGIHPGVRVSYFERKGDAVIIHGKARDGSAVDFREKGVIFIATGIRPNTTGMGLEKAGVERTGDGHIRVNKKMQTTAPHIYAAGDVASTPSYVYTAAYEGKTAVENAFTGAGKEADYAYLPWVVFTDPQVAGTGMDEAQATGAGIPFEVSKLELKDLPRAMAARDTRGFIKLIRNPETGLLIGARIVAPEGGELIQALSMSIKYRIPVNDLAENLYPYLTLSEGIKLAAIRFEKDVSKLSCCAS